MTMASKSIVRQLVSRLEDTTGNPGPSPETIVTTKSSTCTYSARGGRYAEDMLEQQEQMNTEAWKDTRSFTEAADRKDGLRPPTKAPFMRGTTEEKSLFRSGLLLLLNMQEPRLVL